MPLVTNNTKPVVSTVQNIQQATNPQPQQVRAADPAFKGSTVDTRYISRMNVIAHVEGSRLTCNYYSQILGKDQATYGLGKSTLAIHQQLKLVKNMELRVTTQLNYSQDATTKEMIGTGTAIMYPSVIPNEGDIFLADIGDGQEGVFQITTSRRLVIYRETCHEVDYKLIDYVTNHFVEDLASKVVQTFYFERDFIKHGANPLVYENEFHVLQKLRDSYPRILDLYLRRFYSQEFTTLIVPDQSEYTYDIFLVKAFNAHFGRWDSRTYKHIRVLNADEDPAMSAFSLWDAINHRDRMSLNSAFQRAGVVAVTHFHNRSYYDGIRYSGLKRAVYPYDPMPNAQHGLGWGKKSPNEFQYRNGSPGARRISDFISDDPVLDTGASVVDPNDGAIENYDLTWIREMENVRKDDDSGDSGDATCQCGQCSVCSGGDASGGSATVPATPGKSPIIHPAMSGGYYVFSRAFYENDRTSGAQSKLELIVQDYFDSKQISYERLYEVMNDSVRWNAIDSFYYTPILLIMMKVVILSN